MAMLEIRGVRKSFHTYAKPGVRPCIFGRAPKPVSSLDVLRGVDLTVEKGDVVAILGPSGSGKTTLLRCLNFLETADAGQLTFDGETFDLAHADRASIARLRRKTAFVFQNYNLFRNKTALQNVTEGLIVARRMPKAEADAVGMKMLEKVGLADRADYYPRQLSGGQQQRVAIARTLAPEPTVLFMDEPLSNLDAKLRLEMRSELQRLHIDTGSTFIYVTHDQMEAMTLATKICLIDNGVLQQYDAPLDVYNRPNSLFVADFVGNPAINFIEATGKQRPDGGIALDMLGGVSATFTPNEKLDLAKWFRDEDAKDEAKRAREAELAKDKKHVEKANKDTVFRCHIPMVNEAEDFGDEESPTDGDFIIGVRPEFIKLSDSGAIEGEIYSAMPTGMETTVRIKIGDYLLTGVVFGGVLYKIGEKVRLDFDGSGVVLFSRRNGRLISLGSVELK